MRLIPLNHLHATRLSRESIVTLQDANHMVRGTESCISRKVNNFLEIIYLSK